MKKIFSILLIIAMTFSLITGCGSKTDKVDATGPSSQSSQSNNDTDNSGTNNNSSSSGLTDDVQGAELSTFMGKYMDQKSKIWDKMTKKFDEEQNLKFAMGSLAFAFADLAIVEIVLFDSLSIKEGDSFKGKLMLSDIEAWKKNKGDIIEFGYDYNYPEDKNQYKKGDHQVTTGKYDKKSKSLYYENYMERDGKKTSRTVVEVTSNSDNSYSSQTYTINSNNDSSELKSKLNGFFTWFEGENIISVTAEKKDADINFTVNSILGKKDIKPEEMAKDMDITSKTSFIDGKATFDEVTK